MIQFRAQRPQARFDVPQAFAIGQLRKSQAQKLVATREATQTAVATVLADASVELASWQKLQELRKHELTLEHKASPAGKTLPRQGSNVVENSSRVHASVAANSW
jgi:hypothetical protein